MPEIANLPIPYISGCNLSFGSPTTLIVSAGQVRDSTNQYDIVIPNLLTVTATSVGLNGLDHGALGNNLFYNIYIISDSAGFKTPGALLSLSSNNAPFLPYGYDIIRLIGVWLTNGTAQLLDIYQTGNGNDRTFFYDVPVSVLTAGAATTFTSVSLGAGAPEISETVIFNSAFTPAAAADTFTLRPTGSSGTGTIVQSGIVATVAQDAQIQMPVLVGGADTASIDYKVSASGDALALSVAGFTLSL